ncbi:MAG: hypothetical protein WCE49_02020, partial [Terrimicrobiaceae bacterium]
AKGFVWGIGPAFTFPTASSTDLGQGKWGIGPSLVGLYIGKKIVAGALINTVNLSAQVFVNAASPEFGSDWSFRLQCQFLFPR